VMSGSGGLINDGASTQALHWSRKTDD